MALIVAIVYQINSTNVKVTIAPNLEAVLLFQQIQNNNLRLVFVKDMEEDSVHPILDAMIKHNTIIVKKIIKLYELIIQIIIHKNQQTI